MPSSSYSSAGHRRASTSGSAPQRWHGDSLGCGTRSGVPSDALARLSPGREGQPACGYRSHGRGKTASYKQDMRCWSGSISGPRSAPRSRDEHQPDRDQQAETRGWLSTWKQLSMGDNRFLGASSIAYVAFSATTQSAHEPILVSANSQTALTFLSAKQHILRG